jgi:hypothetical protein
LDGRSLVAHEALLALHRDHAGVLRTGNERAATTNILSSHIFALGIPMHKRREQDYTLVEAKVPQLIAEVTTLSGLYSHLPL